MATYTAALLLYSYLQVPFSRLMALNKPEWPYLILGMFASAVVGAVQPAFAFVIRWEHNV